MKIRITDDSSLYKKGDIMEATLLDSGNYIAMISVGHSMNNIIIPKEDAEVVEDVKKSCNNCKLGSKNNNGRTCRQSNCLRDEKWQPIEPVMRETADPSKIIKGSEQMRQATGTTETVFIAPGVCLGEPINYKTGTTEDAKHYQVADIQPIEIMQKYLTPEEMIGAMKMQVIKYILRISHKGSDREDAGKCSQYAKWLCDVMDGVTIVPGGK